MSTSVHPYEYPDNPLYNTRAVSLRTDVTSNTFLAWERRYNVPKPYRTPNGRRLYSERDIAPLYLWLKHHIEMGVSIGQAVNMFNRSHQPTASGHHRGN